MFLCVAIKSSHRKPEDDKIIDSDICCAAGGAGGKLHTVPESAAARPEDASAWSVMLPLRPPVGCFGDTISNQFRPSAFGCLKTGFSDEGLTLDMFRNLKLTINYQSDHSIQKYGLILVSHGSSNVRCQTSALITQI